jgi:hypothetical protein
LVVSLVFGVIVGLMTGWTLWSPRKGRIEVFAPAIRNEDRSLVLEKKPMADAKPAQQVPKGAVVERVVYVEVQPHGPSNVVTTTTPGSTETEHQVVPSSLPSPIRVDLTLYRLQDGTRRVVASSPDGEVVGGLDVPVEAAKSAPKELKWSAGAVYGTTAWGDKSVGAFLDRDIKFLRTGVELTKNTYALSSRTGWEVRAKVGIRF